MSENSDNVQTQVAERKNGDKVPVELVAPEFIWETAKVLEGGAKKYARDQWRQGMKFSTCLGSLHRHIMKWAAGEDIDPEFGCSHLAHAACNLMFLFNYQRMGRTDLDDRQKVPLEVEIKDSVILPSGTYKEGKLVDDRQKAPLEPPVELDVKSLTKDYGPRCYVTAQYPNGEQQVYKVTARQGLTLPAGTKIINVQTELDRCLERDIKEGKLVDDRYKVPLEPTILDKCIARDIADE